MYEPTQGDKDYEAYLESGIFDVAIHNELVIKVSKGYRDYWAKKKLTEWVQNQYFRIIDGRYRRNITTIFTSNLGFNELAKIFDTAIISRLFELTKGRQVEVEAKDYRKVGEKMITEK